MLTDFLFIVSLVGIATLPFIHALWKSEVESYRFKITLIRSSLVLLVAKGRLEKDSNLFEYYYKMANDILDALENEHGKKLLQLLTQTQFSIPSESYNRHIEMLHQDLKCESEEVRQIIATYYQALIDMILVTDSSFFCIVYVLSHRLMKGDLRRKVSQWALNFNSISAGILRRVHLEKTRLELPFQSHV